MSDTPTVGSTLSLTSDDDFEQSDRGFHRAAWSRWSITAADGRVVWDMDAGAFLDADCPDTATPASGARRS